jgi:hypothetical protein
MQSRPKGNIYQLEICSKNCNFELKNNTIEDIDGFLHEHFYDSEGKSNKYCRAVITDSLEWEEYKPR